MISRVVLDTGPLVALLNRREKHHEWAKARFAEAVPPLLTCEAVLTEACHLVRRLPAGSRAVLDLINTGVVAIGFSLKEHLDSVRELLRRYADQPMSLADACLVRMSETIVGRKVLTLDDDSRIYRLHGRQPIPTLIAPR